MSVIDILASGNYITYNKIIARQVGIDEAILFGEFCSKQAIYGDNFYVQMERLVEDTCLTEYRIRKAVKNLRIEGLLSVKKIGVPCKNHYTICEEKVEKIVNVRRTSSIKFGCTSTINFDSTSGTKIDSTKENTKDNTKENTKNLRKVVVDYTENDELRNSFFDFIEMRKKIKAPITAQGLRKAINRLSKLADTDDEKIEVLDQSTMNSWRGLFELKDYGQKNEKGDGKNHNTYELFDDGEFS